MNVGRNSGKERAGMNRKRAHVFLPDDLLADVYAGMWPHEAPRTDEFLSAFVWYGSSRGIARRAGRLRFEYARQGITLALADTLIAATVLEHDLTLITDNRKHFPMPELAL